MELKWIHPQDIDVSELRDDVYYPTVMTAHKRAGQPSWQITLNLCKEDLLELKETGEFQLTAVYASPIDPDWVIVLDLPPVPKQP